MAALSPVQLELIQEILHLLAATPPALPSEPEFRVKHASERTAIDELLSRRVLRCERGHYIPTLAGLRATGTEDARAVVRGCNGLLEWLKEKVRSDPKKPAWTTEELSRGSTFSEGEVKALLAILLSDEPNLSAGHTFELNPPFVTEVRLALDSVLDAQPFPEVEPTEVLVASGPDVIKRLYVHNFRSFVSFEWKPPAACVLVG